MFSLPPRVPPSDLPSVKVVNGSDFFSSEEAAIYAKHDTQDSATTEIRVYYVNRIHASVMEGAKGKAVIPSSTAKADGQTQAKWKNRILCATFTKTKYTLAHELMHILMDGVSSPATLRPIHSGQLVDITKRIPMKQRSVGNVVANGEVRTLRSSGLLGAQGNP